MAVRLIIVKLLLTFIYRGDFKVHYATLDRSRSWRGALFSGRRRVAPGWALVRMVRDGFGKRKTKTAGSRPRTRPLAKAECL